MKLVMIAAALTLLLAACGEQAESTVTPLPSPPPATGTPTTGTPDSVPENGNVAPAPSPVAPTPAPTPGGQVNINNEFWYGSLSRGGASIPGGMGFWQTGGDVAGVLVLADEGGETLSLPRMTGTLSGYDLAISHTDAAGDTGTVEGTFDRSQTSFRGTFTLVVDGEAASFGLTMAYDSQLGGRLQTRSATTLVELAEQLR